MRDYSTAKSRLAFAADLGVDFDLAPNLSIQDGIQATRNLLPKCVIDKTRCYDSVEALRIYRTEYDDRKGLFRDKPFHGPESDYCDSIRYFAVSDTQQSQHSLFGEPLKRARSSTVV